MRAGVAIALLLLALLAGQAEARARWFGFNDNATIAGELTPGADAGLLAAAGANAARITLDWSWVEPRRGQLDLSLYDPIYSALLRRGVRPLLIVTGAPRWAWPPWVWCVSPSLCHFPPDRGKNAAWAHFVATVARRYPAAAAIEVWNEPNLRLFFATGPDPERYTELLRLAHDAVKRVASSLPVLGGSLAADLSERADSDAYALRPFLRAMYAHGARGLMDGISIHPYPPPNTPVAPVYRAINATLQTRNAAGDRAPLWLTETGASTTGGYSPALQAIVLGDLIPRLLRRPEVAAVFVHTLVDPRRATGVEKGYGVLRDVTHPKPAFCAIARVRRAPAHCAAPAAPAAVVARWDQLERRQAEFEAALERAGA